MKRLASIATVLIAIITPLTGANGQEVYRCGNAYSQKPCAQGVRVEVEDSRTAEQKSASDAKIQRELATAHAMEKARLQEDTRQRAQAQKQSTAKAKKAAARPRTTASNADTANPDTAHAGTRKRQSKKKTKAPEFFTARAGAQRPLAAASAGK